MTEKIERDFRRSVEFILRVKPYDEAGLYKKDLISFLEILHEAEAEQSEKNSLLSQYDTQTQ